MHTWLKISGRVQGVGFRAHVRQIALSLKINGWARNEPDDSVLVLVCASPAAASAFVRRISGIHHLIGPDVKKVEIIKSEKTLGNCEHASFLILG
ncbi:MAG: acylphosphatase [Candidatus Micrarchaeia archaeon]